MKPFVVEMTIRTVIMAHDENDAFIAARTKFRDIARDETPDVFVDGEVRTEDDLPDGWDLGCLPHNGDGNTRLAEIIGDLALAQEPGEQKDNAAPLTCCAADQDGECNHAQCPQLRDDEPARSNRHCPLDNRSNDSDY